MTAAANVIRFPATSEVAGLALSRRRSEAWCRILDVVAEQREALEHRIWREDPADTHLEADIQTWCELSRSLTDFVKARAA
jgi:hypothetical protein